MYGRYMAAVVIWSLMLMSPVVGTNYYVDPYGYFRTDFTKQKIEPNQQVVKMKYILANPAKYDCFIFGSSRCGNLNPKKIPGRKSYNMTYSQGLPAEWRSNIEIMLKHGVAIKTLIICLDDFSFRIDPAEHESQWMRLPYREDMGSVYARYLLRIPQMEVLKPYFKDEPPANFFDIYDSGRPLHPQVDRAIELDPEKHINDPRFTWPMKHEGERIEATIAEIKRIKELAEQSQIELIVLMNPVHITSYKANNLEEFNRFKGELAKITPFWDFSPPSSVTTNNYYFYETSHYRPMVGDWMIQLMYQIHNKYLPGDFGEYVTNESVASHISRVSALLH